MGGLRRTGGARRIGPVSKRRLASEVSRKEELRAAGERWCAVSL
jgi:hypothetical protein